MLISYINETNKLYFNFDKIEYFNLKQNILNKKTKCIKDLSDFLKKCKEHLEDNVTSNKEIKYNKIKPGKKNNKMRYTYSTKSFRSKYGNNSTESIERIRYKTVNKTRNDKIKKSRISLIKKKNKK